MKSAFSQQYGWSIGDANKTSRTILTSLLKTYGTSLKDESLRTLLIEVDATVNSRPLTTNLLSDVNSMMPLSPINLLTLKTKVVMPPPGAFTAPDIYRHKRWRRVKHISNEFCSRWRKEIAKRSGRYCPTQGSSSRTK